jgi:8-oxo-dGTP diphosphatase
VLLNGSAESARAFGCAGVHWTAPRLARATARPHDMLCAASCHTRAEIEHAARLGLDFAVLGPVCATPTHRDVTPLGWDRFAALAAEAPLPIYALGGLSAADLDVAVEHGAHGVALRRAAWE